MTHHKLQYPLHDFESDVYRDPGKDNTVFFFGIAFAPFVLTAILLTVFGVIPLGIGIAVLAEMAVIAVLNNYLHDSFHLTKSVWHKWPGFSQLKALHILHHIDMSTNFGIFLFFWDKWVGTYWSDQ